MKLHHIGFVVSNISKTEERIIFEKKINEVYDNIQRARLSLYTNYSNSYIELIEPKDDKSYTWNALQKKGTHMHHLCYQVRSFDEIQLIAVKTGMLEIMKPVPAILFGNKFVTFYYTKERQIVEFLVDSED